GFARETSPSQGVLHLREGGRTGDKPASNRATVTELSLKRHKRIRCPFQGATAKGEAGISPPRRAGICCGSEVGNIVSDVERNSPAVHHFISWMTARSRSVQPSRLRAVIPVQ